MLGADFWYDENSDFRSQPRVGLNSDTRPHISRKLPISDFSLLKSGADFRFQISACHKTQERTKQISNSDFRFQVSSPGQHITCGNTADYKFRFQVSGFWVPQMPREADQNSRLSYQISKSHRILKSDSPKRKDEFSKSTHFFIQISGCLCISDFSILDIRAHFTFQVSRYHRKQRSNLLLETTDTYQVSDF